MNPVNPKDSKKQEKMAYLVERALELVVATVSNVARTVASGN